MTKFKWITRPGENKKGERTTYYLTQVGHIYWGEVVVGPEEVEHDGSPGQSIEASVYIMDRRHTGYATGRGAKTPYGVWSLKVAQKWVKAHIRELARHLYLMGRK